MTTPLPLPGPNAAALPVPDFEARLIALVDAEMDRLTEANALDEWHVDYLDPRISAQVNAEHTRIDAASHGRRASLVAQQRTLEARIASLAAQRETACERVARAQAELDRRVAEISPLVGTDPVEGTGVTTAAAILRVLESTAPTPAAERRRRGDATETELRAKLEIQEQLLHKHETLVAAQHRAVDRAREAREAAELHFRTSDMAPGFDLGADLGPAPTAPTERTAPARRRIPGPDSDESRGSRAVA